MSDPLSASAEFSLADDVATYVGFGAHRAGTPEEEATAHWFSERLQRAGYETALQRFPIRTLLNPGGHLSTASASADGFPQWLPPAAAVGAVLDLPLLPLDAEADAGVPTIRLMTAPAPLKANWSKAQDALVSEAIGKGARALVLAPDEPTGDLYVSNQMTTAPLPIPVLLLARRALAPFAAAASRQERCRLSITGTLVETTAINVVARKAGRGKTIVVSTPLTGWFRCGGERGPGIAVLLRTAQALAALDNPVIALGTGSHEIGHRGMEHVLAQGLLPPADVGFWFHFGASLAATKRDAPDTTSHLVVGTEATEALVRPAFASLVKRYANGSGRTGGESGQVLGAGYTRFAGMVGTFPTFHTPADLGDAIDYRLLEKIAAASLAVITDGACT